MAIDISTYLNAIKTGVPVNTVRSGVGGAVRELKTYLNADNIDQELYDIEHGIYGRDIREAIYSALDKLSKKEGGSAVPVYSSFAPIFDNTLTGTVATYEEVQNGD